jgi:4-hydroxybenzoate polyprenyltransferase
MKLNYLFLSLRPTHWLKNILIFMPLLFAQELFIRNNVIYSLWSFFAFCATASSIYIFNDLLDKKSDSHHALKKTRPIASGKIPLSWAIVTIYFLSIVALVIAHYQINDRFLAIILIYYVLGVSYTLWLKHVVILDVLVISAFYLLRIFAGCVAIDVKMSYWIIICIALLAMFISFNKRRHEIKFLNDSKASLHREVLSKYDLPFIDQMISVVNAATLISYTLYTIDPETIARFGTSMLIVTVPFVYYGIFRYLYIVHHKDEGGDPVKTFLTDIPSIINGLLWFIMCVLIIYVRK